MTVDVATAVMLIAVPIAFNLAFFELGRAFDYPDILRKAPGPLALAVRGPGTRPTLYRRR